MSSGDGDTGGFAAIGSSRKVVSFDSGPSDADADADADPSPGAMTPPRRRRDSPSFRIVQRFITGRVVGRWDEWRKASAYDDKLLVTPPPASGPQQRFVIGTDEADEAGVVVMVVVTNRRAGRPARPPKSLARIIRVVSTFKPMNAALMMLTRTRRVRACWVRQ